MTIERDVENFLVTRVKRIGAECFKWTAPGVRGVPDRLVIYAGRIWFVELQQPGKKPRMNQVMMHKRLARQGFKVNIVDSKIAASEFVEEVKSWKQNSEGTSNTP